LGRIDFGNGMTFKQLLQIQIMSGRDRNQAPTAASGEWERDISWIFDHYDFLGFLPMDEF
jgi:hypothetical protein